MDDIKKFLMNKKVWLGAALIILALIVVSRVSGASVNDPTPSVSFQDFDSHAIEGQFERGDWAAGGGFYTSESIWYVEGFYNPTLPVLKKRAHFGVRYSDFDGDNQIRPVVRVDIFAFKGFYSEAEVDYRFNLGSGRYVPTFTEYNDYNGVSSFDDHGRLAFLAGYGCTIPGIDIGWNISHQVGFGFAGDFDGMEFLGSRTELSTTYRPLGLALTPFVRMDMTKNYGNEQFLAGFRGTF